jgi:hypothetical protein
MRFTLATAKQLLTFRKAPIGHRMVLQWHKRTFLKLVYSLSVDNGVRTLVTRALTVLLVHCESTLSPVFRMGDRQPDDTFQ